jgi:hypothetical protein
MMTLPDHVVSFVSGLVAFGYALIAVFFLRFWSQIRDSLFFTFALAFFLLALNAALPALLEVPKEEQSPFYLLRLGAFLLIIGAVVRKNLGKRS